MDSFFHLFLNGKKNWWLQIGKTDKTDSGLYFHALLVNKPIWRGKHKITILLITIFKSFYCILHEWLVENNVSLKRTYANITELLPF